MIELDTTCTSCCQDNDDDNDEDDDDNDEYDDNNTNDDDDEPESQSTKSLKYLIQLPNRKRNKNYLQNVSHLTCRLQFPLLNLVMQGNVHFFTI